MMGNPVYNSPSPDLGISPALVQAISPDPRQEALVLRSNNDYIPFPIELVGVKGKVSSSRLSSSKLREVGGRGSGEGSLLQGQRAWVNEIYSHHPTADCRLVDTNSF